MSNKNKRHPPAIPTMAPIDKHKREILKNLPNTAWA